MNLKYNLMTICELDANDYFPSHNEPQNSVRW